MIQILKLGVADQPGYTGFANFISAPEYMNFRRFEYLRMRILLRQQFKITCLENELRRLDREDMEDHALWLISQKLEGNEKRETLFAELETALAKYGQ